MCGIVGYLGDGNAAEFLLEGLQRLEYRGYDSAGVAVVTRSGRIQTRRNVGRIKGLADRLKREPLSGTVGIGHTRWATHGAPTERNAHPHIGGNELLALVHNGVIENHQELRDELTALGYVFRSESDSEVIAHLIASLLDDAHEQRKGRLRPLDDERLTAAVKSAVGRLRGTYGLAVAFRGRDDLLIAARLGSPLVVGLGRTARFISSDASALVGFAERIVTLADHQVAVVKAASMRVVHRDEGDVAACSERLALDSVESDLQDHSHYMLKEIYEQPRSLENAMRGRLQHDDATAVFGGLNLTPRQLQSVKRIVLTACGTSWHAALVGEYLIEELARIPVEVEYASELRYRNPPLDRDTLVFALSQSGETADTLAALGEIQRKGHPALAICNVVGSSISQVADGGIYLHAGPEIGVASTKAYTSQCLVLALLALYFGRLHHLSFEAGRKIIDALQRLPEMVKRALKTDDAARRIAAKYVDVQNVLYLGRQFNFPTALEGALKLKEISYIHAEGYPAAEMKHGPIALVDERTPSVFIVSGGAVYDKVLSNLAEVKARGGPVIAVIAEEDNRIEDLADDVIRVPAVEDFLQPLVSIIPLQLLAYHIATLRGCDVDKPRNLAKSVTVE